MYILEHGYRFFAGQVTDYWNAPFMYPEPGLIAFSDNLLGIVPFYSCFRAIGASRESAFILLFILLSLLNYVSCYYLLKHLFRWPVAAALGALVFAGSLALQSQIPHAQTFPRFPVPLAFLFALRFFETLKPQMFTLTLVTVAYQFYCGFYLGFLLVVPLIVFFIASFFFGWPRYRQAMTSRRWWLRIVAGGIASGLLLVPLMVPYLKRASSTGYHGFDLVVLAVPETVSRLFSRAGSLAWDFLSEINIDHPFYYNDQIFPGGAAIIGFLVFTVAVIARWKNTAGSVRLLLVTGWIVVLIFTRVGHTSLYVIPYKLVPGFASVKAVQRIINIELLFYACGVAFAVRWLVQKWDRPMWILFAGCALIVADNWLDPERIIRTDRLAAAERVRYVVNKYDAAQQLRATAPRLAAEGTPTGPVLAYEPDPLSEFSVFYHLDAMLAAQELGVPTVNGYSANCPHEFGPYWNEPREAHRKSWLEHKGMAGLNVQVVK